VLPSGSKVYQLTDLFSAGEAKESKPFEFQGSIYEARSKTHWKTTRDGLRRLGIAGRIECRGGRPWFRKFHSDFPVSRFTNVWSDTSGKATERIYVVQTQEKVIARCILMATQPGDLVLDPTCGSGTTATLAEQWGRRWITIDTSRVALALARARIMGARYPFTCCQIPAMASSRKPKLRAPRRVRSPFIATSATASSMSACRTSCSVLSPGTRRSMSSGSNGKQS